MNSCKEIEILYKNDCRKNKGLHRFVLNVFGACIYIVYMLSVPTKRIMSAN